MGLTMKERQSLTRETCTRYRAGSKQEKTKILDEFAQVTGYHRKYALAILTHWGKEKLVRLDGELVKLKAGTAKRRKGGGRKPVYGPEVIASLRPIWAFFWYRCGKLLAPFLRQQMGYLEAWEAFHITPDIKTKLLKISPATIDRALKGDRKKLALKGVSGTKPGKLLKKHILVRVYYPWNDRKPGFFEIDTVHHCGNRDEGEFCLTLTVTDVFSGWVELRALLNKAQKWTFVELSALPAALPFPLLGIDSDNGSEFINRTLSSWCDKNSITFTRSRPYHKNDNCFVEQKNLACVRDYVGYARFDTASEREILASVYHALCPLLNYFLPTVKLIDKTRVGSRVRKVYDQPVSPYQRLLSSPDLPEKAKAELKRQYQCYNPVLLQQEVHRAVDTLMDLHRQKDLVRHQSLAAAALEDY
jgi:transposase InsO family protein